MKLRKFLSMALVGAVAVSAMAFGASAELYKGITNGNNAEGGYEVDLPVAVRAAAAAVRITITFDKPAAWTAIHGIITTNSTNTGYKAAAEFTATDNSSKDFSVEDGVPFTYQLADGLFAKDTAETDYAKIGLQGYSDSQFTVVSVIVLDKDGNTIFPIPDVVDEAPVVDEPVVDEVEPAADAAEEEVEEVEEVEEPDVEEDEDIDVDEPDFSYEEDEDEGTDIDVEEVEESEEAPEAPEVIEEAPATGDADAANTNPKTGVAVALIPAVLAAGALVISRKKSK